MSHSIFWTHAAVLCLAILTAYVFYMRTLRIQAKFSLYKVRDDFVYLVASEQIGEDCKVFQHYYSRINSLLAAAPSVGLDDILQLVFHTFKTKEEFDNMIRAANRQMEIIKRDPVFQNAAVREAVAEYYKAVRLLVLSHSSNVRIAYLVTKCLLHRDDVFVPIPVVKHGLDAVNYAERGAKVIAA